MAEIATANIQVFGADDEAPDDLARRVARAIKEVVTAEGFEAVPAGEASDRELAIVLATQKGRVTVLDEAGDQSPEAIETLARQLSQSLNALTLSVLGSPKASAVALHGGGATLSLLPEDARESELHDAWGELLVGGNTPQDLAGLWGKPGNPLAKTAELLCIEPSLMTVNYAALGRLGRSGARLRFKSTGGMVTVSGPRLRAAAMPGPKAPKPGEPFLLGVVVQNRGAPGAGVELTLRGRLLTEEWLEVRNASLSGRDFQEEQRPRFRTVRSDRVFQARFEKAPLAAAGSPDVLRLTLECQLTRALPKPEPLKVSLDPVGSPSGGCSVDVPVG